MKKLVLAYSGGLDTSSLTVRHITPPSLISPLLFIFPSCTLLNLTSFFSFSVSLFNPNHLAFLLNLILPSPSFLTHHILRLFLPRPTLSNQANLLPAGNSTTTSYTPSSRAPSRTYISWRDCEYHLPGRWRGRQGGAHRWQITKG